MKDFMPIWLFAPIFALVYMFVIAASPLNGYDEHISYGLIIGCLIWIGIELRNNRVNSED